MTDPYNEATMGYHDGSKSDLSGISYLSRSWDMPHLVGYMESHDEQRLMYKNQTWGNSSGNYDVKGLNTGLARMEAAATFFFTVPGPKMVWQFGELGYDVDIDEPCRVCRKPIRWEYFDHANRYRLYQVFSALIRLRTEEDLFETTDFSLDVSSALKKMHLNSSSMNAAILGNFDVETNTIDPSFQHTGTWYEYFTGTSIEVNDVNEPIQLAPGEYKLYTDVELEKPVINALGQYGMPSSGQYSLYPNPSDGKVQFTTQNPGTLDFELYSINGNLIFDRQVIASGPEQVSFNLKNKNGEMKKGIYIYKISDARSTSTGKLIIQ
jgi:hypothetical protein